MQVWKPPKNLYLRAQPYSQTVYQIRYVPMHFKETKEGQYGFIQWIALIPFHSSS
jgi:hypothetical protein